VIDVLVIYSRGRITYFYYLCVCVCVCACVCVCDQSSVPASCHELTQKHFLPPLPRHSTSIYYLQVD